MKKPFEEQRSSVELGTFAQPLFVERIESINDPKGSEKNEEQKRTVCNRAPDNGFGD